MGRYSTNMQFDNLLQRFERLSTTSNTVSTLYRTGSDLAWETALTEVLAVLKIQYRSDISVSTFLASDENVRQLKYSHVARMEYNRRCIHEDVNAGGMHSAPRARRIAKECAIDYIRRFLDGEHDRFEVSSINMVRKISTIANERDAAIEHSVNVELLNTDLRREKDALILENADIEDTKASIEASLAQTQDILKDTENTVANVEIAKKSLEMNYSSTQRELEGTKGENSLLRDDLQSLRSDIASARTDNAQLRAECQEAWKESAERRDEISVLKAALEKQRMAAGNSSAQCDSLKIQNETLQHQNHTYKENNLSLRDQNNVLKAREEEMRTLVTVQLNLLSPEKVNHDMQFVRHSQTEAPEQEATVEDEKVEDCNGAECSGEEECVAEEC